MNGCMACLESIRGRETSCGYGYILDRRKQGKEVEEVWRKEDIGELTRYEKGPTINLS